MKPEDFTFYNYPYAPKSTFEAAKKFALKEYKDWPNDDNQSGRIEACIAAFQCGVLHNIKEQVFSKEELVIIKYILIDHGFDKADKSIIDKLEKITSKL